MKRDRDAGRDADFVLVLVGHGAVDGDGEGWVSLLDGKLTRTKLLDGVIARSPARFNHVIVDACSAYHVLYRGGDQAVSAVKRLLEAQSLAHYPNTGVLLATSSARETHEWSRIRGGVFSHEVLAALSGAADVDGDGAVSYAEVGAFIEAANAGVVDERARVEFTLKPPPLFLGRPLAAVPAAGPRLRLAQADTGHFVVEDARGVTVAEVNKDAEQPLSLALVGEAPFRVVRGAEAWIDDVEGLIGLGKLSRVDGEKVAARSGVSDALARGLFRTPFGRSWVEGYAARLVAEPPAPAAVPFPWAATGFASVGGALAVGAAATGALAIAGVVELGDGKGRITAVHAQDVVDRTNAAFVASGALLAGAAVAGAVSAVLFATAP